MIALAATVESLMTAVPQLEADALSEEALAEIVERGVFRPAQDEALGHWFARFLSLRDALRAVINEADAAIDVPLWRIRDTQRWRSFVVGYAAACLLVRQDRFLLQRFATHTAIQRKLNEAFPEYRIERKHFSAIFSGCTDPLTALQLFEAMRVARRRRRHIAALIDDPQVGRIVRRLPQLECHLDPSKRSFVRHLLRFLRHRWRRRGASARQQTAFAVLEGFGRTASRINPGKVKRVTAAVRDEVAALLRPGDVIVSRHRYALTNYPLPGVWPHVSLYIGTAQQRDELGVDLDPVLAARWCGDRCTLEALRDGVRFRPLAETLNVDAFAILHPRVSVAGIAQALARAAVHEGKGYNFDFDFFTSDRLVCTEVVYRAYDGVEGMEFPLVERAGRQTLSAEDLLDIALDRGAFTPVALFGWPAGAADMITGEHPCATNLNRPSYWLLRAAAQRRTTLIVAAALFLRSLAREPAPESPLIRPPIQLNSFWAAPTRLTLTARPARAFLEVVVYACYLFGSLVAGFRCTFRTGKLRRGWALPDADLCRRTR